MDRIQMDNSTNSYNSSDGHLVTHSLWEIVTIATVSAIVSLVTITGNVLVMISFKVNSQLKTVNNYYLLSLAVADLIIGIFSMNLYTSYILMGYWSLGSLACDLWLAMDYVVSNASVMNLLVISFDRYFSITRPLTYRAKRTPKRAGIMIGLAWLVSLILWAPPILCWQYFVGKRTVPERQCQIQFFSEPVITFGTAIAAFYIPVSVMTILYCRIYKETERRTKDLAELQEVNHSIDSDITNKSQTPIMRSFFTTTPRRQNQISWASSYQNNPSKFATTFKEEWSKTGHVPTFASYGSSEEEECAPGVLVVYRNHACREKNTVLSNNGEEENFFLSQGKNNPPKCKKCISYRNNSTQTKKLNSRAAKSMLSMAKSMNMQSTALSSNPNNPPLKSQITKRKRMVLIKERKAAQTLSAILLAFILTWTPYNIMVLVSTFCSDCIPLSLWHLGYWLCYVNSTVNPMCYALCNKTFRKTFRLLLLCQWKRKLEDKLC
ncbi:muscarinic acetylcholine receptor M5a [Clarias gariepinus]|uniref:muscarinic acetylcholine receptor M5a n=1 Tax=Clarias gariepinus TaxID=13013 RepID=UPI00234C1436|nr:muscarinic acetylcholine receptor M5a [Clarias gariepinus]